MSLSIGIVGLPNVGKSTLFNALLKRQVALAANYPFATIEPNVGVVDVPDIRLGELAKIVKAENPSNPTAPEKIVPATSMFHDIAGLVAGASKGEGLGNKFLAHIRETDAIIQVVRSFSDTNVVREGAVSPESDIQVINTELMLADLATLTARVEKHTQILKRERSAENVRRQELYDSLFDELNKGQLVAPFVAALTAEDLKLVKDLNLLTAKPMIYVYNVSEDEVAVASTQNTATKINLSAKIESELSALSPSDATEYMASLGIAKSGLDQVITTSYALLNLQTYLTAGPKEVRAWTISKGTKAPQAAGKIHTDFEKGFIKAQVVSYDDLIASQGFKGAKEKGLLRLEGKDYVMQDGDVVEFRFNN